MPVPGSIVLGWGARVKSDWVRIRVRGGGLGTLCMALRADMRTCVFVMQSYNLRVQG